MNCNEVKTQLSAYLDGELGHQEAEQIRAHLKDCPDCAEEYRQLASTWDALLADEDIGPSPDFASRFWQKARVREEQRPALLRLLKWAPAMAAGFLVAFLAGWLSAGGMTPGDVSGASDEVAFLRDYEMVEKMDLLEDFPMLEVEGLNDGEGGEE